MTAEGFGLPEREDTKPRPRREGRGARAEAEDAGREPAGAPGPLGPRQGAAAGGSRARPRER